MCITVVYMILLLLFVLGGTASEMRDLSSRENIASYDSRRRRCWRTKTHFWTSFVTRCVGMSQQKHPLTNHYLRSKRLYKLFDKWYCARARTRSLSPEHIQYHPPFAPLSSLTLWSYEYTPPINFFFPYKFFAKAIIRNLFSVPSPTVSRKFSIKTITTHTYIHTHTHTRIVHGLRTNI